MQSTLVSARVPVARKEAAQSALQQLGLSTTELINSAFDYLIENRSLPTAEKELPRTDEGFDALLAECTLAVPWPEEDVDYRDIVRKGKQERYESLA